MEKMANGRFEPEGSLLQTPENQVAIATVEGLRRAWRNQQILEARALKCDNAHNLVIELGAGITGIIPREEGAVGIKEGKVRDIALIARAGKPVCFIVTRLYEDAQGHLIAVCSRRLAQQLCQEQWADLLHPGDLLWARITHIDSFGCFADIGCGITALLPIDATGVSRISHPGERFTQGQLIPVLMRIRDEQGRLVLTHKELLGTWEENAALFSPGETVSGVVRSVEEYGVFVELTPNLAGLAELREGIAPGMQTTVYIKNIIPARMKIKLVLVDAYPASVGSLPSKHPYHLPSGRLHRWQYSPDCCTKLVETIFDDPDDPNEEVDDDKTP